MEYDFDLWSALHTWKQQVLPPTMLQRTQIVDAVRALRQTRADAPVDIVLDQLRVLWSGLQAEGMDRPIARPPSREPSELDLELVAWELVVTPEVLSPSLPDPALWGEPGRPAQLELAAGSS